jgi:hypothetical protein
VQTDQATLCWSLPSLSLYLSLSAAPPQSPASRRSNLASGRATGGIPGSLRLLRSNSLPTTVSDHLRSASEHLSRSLRLAGIAMPARVSVLNDDIDDDDNNNYNDNMFMLTLSWWSVHCCPHGRSVEGRFERRAQRYDNSVPEHGGSLGDAVSIVARATEPYCIFTAATETKAACRVEEEEKEEKEEDGLQPSSHGTVTTTAHVCCVHDTCSLP